MRILGGSLHEEGVHKYEAAHREGAHMEKMHAWERVYTQAKRCMFAFELQVGVSLLQKSTLIGIFWYVNYE
jgi:hypothetical protein